MGYREEIKAANAQGRTMEDRWKLRAAVREKYGMGEEKRKRGGLAGQWDRNKNVIKPLATAAMGMTPLGWAGGAALGGLMGGLDREGKGGIGFDAGEGLKGGLQGAATGALGQYVGKNMLGMESAGSKLPGFLGGPKKPVTASNPTGGVAAPAPTSAGTAVDAATGTPTAQAAAAPAQKSLRDKVMGFVKDAPQAVGGAFTAGSEMYNAGVNRDISRQNTALSQQQFELERQQYEDMLEERKKREAIAAQLYAQLMGQMSWNKNPVPQSF